MLLFLEKSRFCLWVHDGRTFERCFLECDVEIKIAITIWVMSCGGISQCSTTPLVFFQGQSKAQKYINNVLEPFAVSYIRGIDNNSNVYFQRFPNYRKLLGSIWLWNYIKYNIYINYINIIIKKNNYVELKIYFLRNTNKYKKDNVKTYNVLIKHCICKYLTSYFSGTVYFI